MAARAHIGITNMAFVCGFGFALLATAACRSFPRERLLTDLAHRVITIDTGRDAQGDPKVTLHWLTANRLLIITTSYVKSNGNDWKGWADLYNTTRRTRTRLVGLTRVLNKRGRAHWGLPVGFLLSPKGSRLYWWGERLHPVGNHGWIEFGSAVSTVQGRQLREWQWKTSPSFWTGDHHVVEMFDASDHRSLLKIYDVRNSRGDRMIERSAKETVRILKPCTLHHPVDYRNALLNDGHLHITRQWFDRKTQEIIFTTDILQLPKNVDVIGDVSESHQGAAPILLQFKGSSNAGTDKNGSPSSSAISGITQGLWMQHPGIQNMEEIGHIPVRVDKNNHIIGNHLGRIQWLPDGRHISFVCGGMLYVLRLKPKDR